MTTQLQDHLDFKTTLVGLMFQYRGHVGINTNSMIPIFFKIFLILEFYCNKDQVSLVEFEVAARMIFFILFMKAKKFKVGHLIQNFP